MAAKPRVHAGNGSDRGSAFYPLNANQSFDHPKMAANMPQMADQALPAPPWRGLEGPKAPPDLSNSYENRPLAAIFIRECARTGMGVCKADCPRRNYFSPM